MALGLGHEHLNKSPCVRVPGGYVNIGVGHDLYVSMGRDLVDPMIQESETRMLNKMARFLLRSKKIPPSRWARSFYFFLFHFSPLCWYSPERILPNPEWQGPYRITGTKPEYCRKFWRKEWLLGPLLHCGNV